MPREEDWLRNLLGSQQSVYIYTEADQRKIFVAFVG